VGIEGGAIGSDPDAGQVAALCARHGLNAAYLRRRRVAPIGMVDGALVLATAASDSDDEAVRAIAWAVRMPVVPRPLGRAFVAAALGEGDPGTPRVDPRAARLLARTPGAEAAYLARRILVGAIERDAARLVLIPDGLGLVLVEEPSGRREPVAPELAGPLLRRFEALSGAGWGQPATQGRFTIDRAGSPIQVGAWFAEDGRLVLTLGTHA
jgi:hypothetical protein